MTRKPAIDLLSPSSMGVRLTPINRQPVGNHDTYVMHATSAETNVLSVSASLGLKTMVLTKFVSDSPIAKFIQSDLRKRAIAYAGLSVEQEGPWGYRHQFNIADSGYGLRGPKVHNDRAGEIGQTMCVADFDLEDIFVTQGVRHVHFSGLIVALSEKTANLCLTIANIAKANGSTISFDLNYRASFWKNRTIALKSVFENIASLSDILIGNEEDFQLCLGIQGPDAGGKSVHDHIEHFKEMIHNVQKMYPKTKMFATTLREVLNANEHLWGAIVRYEDKWTVIEPRSIQVLDRIGGGDGFVGGLLYGYLNGFDQDKMVQFAWATGVLATTLLEDYACPESEAQIWDIYHGNARVKR
jgi:2-dehydro-3-deoxygluconokinase